MNFACLIEAQSLVLKKTSSSARRGLVRSPETLLCRHTQTFTAASFSPLPPATRQTQAAT